MTKNEQLRRAKNLAGYALTALSKEAYSLVEDRLRDILSIGEPSPWEKASVDDIFLIPFDRDDRQAQQKSLRQTARNYQRWHQKNFKTAKAEAEGGFLVKRVK